MFGTLKICNAEKDVAGGVVIVVRDCIQAYIAPYFLKKSLCFRLPEPVGKHLDELMQVIFVAEIVVGVWLDVVDKL